MSCALLSAQGFVAPSSARAEDAVTRTAKRHFGKGEKLFALGHFDEALEEYQAAFDAKPIAGFLFNIGQCYRNLGDYDQAIFSFRKYLTLEPEAPNREGVEKYIEELEQAKSKQEGKRLIGDGRGDVKPPVADKPVYKRWWFWTGIGVAAAAGGTAAFVLTRPKGAPGTTLGDILINK
jgi:tetratricopeptide (TPR) repeat protein